MSTDAATSQMRDKTTAIVESLSALEGPLLPILHAVQAEFGYVPDAMLPLIAEKLNLTRAEVYGVRTFYHDFRDSPAPGRIVKICRAEACQAMGANQLSRKLLADLDIHWGEPDPETGVIIKAVYCLGLCALAPAAMVDGKPYGRLNAEKLSDLVAEPAP